MAIRRLSKHDSPMSFGVFRPVGHVVVAFDSEAVAAEAAALLRSQGFDDEDLLLYSADEEGRLMSAMLDHTSGSAGFGYEITLMRRYQALARQGCGWLVVYAPDDAHAQRVGEVAERFKAKLAERYHRLLIEDLI